VRLDQVTNGLTMTLFGINAARRSMRFVTESTKWWAVVFILSHSAIAQQSSQENNTLDCVTELNIPVYEGISGVHAFRAM